MHMAARSAELPNSAGRHSPVVSVRPMSRSTATSFDGYRSPVTTDHFCGWPSTIANL
jgi:hypothetical protein